MYNIYWIQRLGYCNVNNDFGIRTVDLPNTVFKLVQVSFFPSLFLFFCFLFLFSEILAAFLLFVKKKTKTKTNAIIQNCKVKVLGVIRDARTPTDHQSIGRPSRRVNPLRDPCDISLGLSRIPLNNLYIQRLFEIRGGSQLPFRSKRNRNPNRPNGKNRKLHLVSNPRTRQYFSRKPKIKC